MQRGRYLHYGRTSYSLKTVVKETLPPLRAANTGDRNQTILYHSATVELRRCLGVSLAREILGSPGR